MKKAIRMRMALGGAICGGFLGILGGGLVGAVYGAFAGDVGLGLDGALLGGVLLASGGAVFGAALGPPVSPPETPLEIKPPPAAPAVDDQIEQPVFHRHG